MPLIACSKCGEDTFTITGWADVDHCPYCGASLTSQRPSAPSSDALRRRSEATTEDEPCSTPMSARRDEHTVAS